MHRSQTLLQNSSGALAVVQVNLVIGSDEEAVIPCPPPLPQPLPLPKPDEIP